MKEKTDLEENRQCTACDCKYVVPLTAGWFVCLGCGRLLKLSVVPEGLAVLHLLLH